METMCAGAVLVDRVRDWWIIDVISQEPKLRDFVDVFHAVRRNMQGVISAWHTKTSAFRRSSVPMASVLKAMRAAPMTGMHTIRNLQVVCVFLASSCILGCTSLYGESSTACSVQVQISLSSFLV